MGIQDLSQNVLLVDLPFGEPQIADELKNLNEIVSNRNDCDVIIDFFRAEMITSSSINNLIILRGLLHERGRQLLLCNVAVVTSYIFTVAGLNGLFDFVDDRHAALKEIQPAG